MQRRANLASCLRLLAFLGLAGGPFLTAAPETGAAWRFYRRIDRPAVPAAGTSWARNPVDVFISVGHAERGLKPRPEAPPPVLLRRLHFDLVGLPPSPEELHAFLADSAPDAHERAADRLLANPHHGERWGRHWMDIWRYSDWAGWGEQVRDSQPHIWRWRDWIVESLNADKGYDRMLLEMLAGDEIAPEDPAVLRATGFLARNFKLLSREKWMEDTVNHTAQAFLGATLGCARCHDHRNDPITQTEYYAVRAIFEPHNVRLDRVPGQPDVKRDGLPRAFDAEPAAATYLYRRGDERTPDKEHPLAPGLPAVFGGPALHVEPVSLPLTASVPEKLDSIREETRRESEERIAAARAALEKARSAPADKQPGAGDLRLLELALPLAEAEHAALEATLRVERLEDAGGERTDPEAWKAAATAAAAAQRQAGRLRAGRDRHAAELELARARAAVEAAATAAGAGGGGQDSKGKEAAKGKETAEKAAAALKQAEEKLPAAEKALAEAEAAASSPPTTEYRKRELKTYPAASTGRRLGLARWLASRDNPLAARVAANHIWARRFGRGIVPSVGDFGPRGKPASHPELLDWLAAELMEPGGGAGAAPWSMKRLHRLLVESSTYRQASTPEAANLAADPDNVGLWRMPSRRLEAEVVRDSLLGVAGVLDLALGGPELDHAQGLTAGRRSLYFRHAPEKRMTFLATFDGPDPSECYERKESLVPQQALALANSQLALEKARLLARRLDASASSEANGGSPGPAFAAAAFERVLSRAATAAELEACVRFLQDQERLLRATEGGLQGAADPTDASKPALDPRLRARENLAHALFNHNDFITVR